MPGPKSGDARHPGTFVIDESVIGGNDFIVPDGNEDQVVSVPVSSMPPTGGYKISNIWIDPNGTTFRWSRAEDPEL